MFFIVTTGRSGSTSIANYLSTSSNIICLHEPTPALIKEATEYLHGTLNEEALKKILLSTREKEINGREYGESNQKLSFIIPLLNDAFDNCKFIWLIRDGRTVVSSIYGLGWYNPEFRQKCEWRENLPQAPKIGEIGHKEWDTMSPFEKCCWYWSFTNRKIEMDLKNISKDKWITIHIENVDICKLNNFLNIEQKSKTIPWVNKKRKMNSDQKWTEWDENQKLNFMKICGDQMNMHYPGWIDRKENWICHDSFSAITKLKHKIQDKMVAVPGKQSILYKSVSIPIKIVFRKHSTMILNKLDYLYKRISGEY